MRSLEAIEQERVIQWARWMSGKYPELELLFHIPNGGRRDRREAAHLKRLGVKPGVSDLFLPVPRGGYHGLWIEMKAPEGTLSMAQKEWLEAMKDQGYVGFVCYGADEACDIIEKYIKG